VSPFEGGIDFPGGRVYPKVVPRQPRIEFAGAVYHLVNRGNGGQRVFRDDADRELFLNILGEACAKTGWRGLAWCLLPDEFHLVVETPQPNLVAGMKWFLGTYTIKFNRRHRTRGHLFAGRYRSLLIEAQADAPLAQVCAYTHLRPAARRLLAAGQALADYFWSSYPHYLREPGQRPAWMAAAPLFAALKLADDAAGRQALADLTEDVRRQGADPAWRAIERGWCLGSDAFRMGLREKLAPPGRHAALPNREMARDQAELILREELGRLGWTEDELAARAKGDPEKIRLARRLRGETTISLRWVAQRLKMGSWTHTANCLYRRDSGNAGAVPAQTAAPARKRAARRPKAASRPAVESPSPRAPAVEELPVHCL